MQWNQHPIFLNCESDKFSLHACTLCVLLLLFLYGIFEIDKMNVRDKQNFHLEKERGVERSANVEMLHHFLDLQMWVMYVAY